MLPDTCAKMFGIDGEVGGIASIPENLAGKLRTMTETQANGIVQTITEKNGVYFDSEMEKLEKWADDLKAQLEAELHELDRDIKDAKKEAKKVADLDQKLALHKRAKELEAKRKAKRKSLYEAQDEVEERKDNLIGEVEAKLRQTVEKQEVFVVKWRVG